jgi:hypothetical protein
MSDESRSSIVKDLAAFQMDHFDDSISSEIQSNGFESSAKNPFLDSPKKSAATKLFSKPSTDMFMPTKNNRYDVFKDEFVSNGHESVAKPAEMRETKTEMSSQDPFKDFAVAAFSEFKVEKSSLHEFSNKLFQQPNSNGHQRTPPKVKKNQKNISHTIIISSQL